MMNRYLVRVTLAVIFLSLVSWVFDAQGQDKLDYVPGEIIVKFKSGVPPDEISAIQTMLNATPKRHFEIINAELWTIGAMSVPDAITAVRIDPRVEYVEPNYIVRADDLFPNDPRFPEMWGLHNTGQTGGTPDADIDAPEAWSIETGDTVLVGVIDTGVDWHHVDLAANIYTNPDEIPGNGVDDDGNGYVDDVHGWDFVNNDNDPYDDNGHGTHVAGTVAAVGNNGVGVVGVSWSAKILPIKFLNAGGSGSTSDAILSVEYATLMHARLTNNSWGGGSYSVALRSAIEAAGTEGILFVAAAGNSGLNTDIYPHYPSSYDLDNIISVAYTTDRDQLNPLSNYGLSTVDLGAPGTNILSTFPGNTYGSISGTSMATPHVSGAVSLLWSAAPSLSHLEAKQIIFSSVDVIPALEGRTVTGGRLNVFNMLSGLDSIPPARINDLAVDATGSNTVTLAWTATGDDGAEGTASAYDLRYSTSQIYWNNFDSATPVAGVPAPKPSGSPETFMVTGLDFTTTYYFALVAVDEQDNRSWLSNLLVSGTTLGTPALEYAPTSFGDSLLTGGSSAHVLTISNTGEGTLDFTFPGVETTGPGAAPSAFPSWIRAVPPSGRVWAGEHFDVELVLDATGLFEGDYIESVVLETNDPLHGAVPIPVVLHVTNAPDIAASPESMNFGGLYIGVSKIDTLVVTNIGTEILTVSGLGVDDPDFSVDPTGFLLGIGASRVVPVTFSPATAGTIAGTLSIASNDPDHPTLEVHLEGQGVEPPVISVTPSSLSEDLYTGGTSTQTLTIANSGGNNLEFDIGTETIEALGGPARVATSVRIPPSGADFPRGTYPPSFGPAPQDGQAAGSAPSNTSGTLAPGGSAFSTETSYMEATRFSLDTPEVLNFVGAAPQFTWAGDFAVGDNSFAYAINDMNQFVRIDTLDGAQTLLGTLAPYGGETWTGMALDPTDGTMYATSTSIGSSSLYVIDVEAVTATRVGPIGLPGIISLAVDTDGAMFAHDIVTDELISIDKTTGLGTSIGLLGFDANFGQGMAFDPVTEELYLAAFNNYAFRAELRIADRTTGATALVGVLGETTPGGIVQLGWLGVPGLGGVSWLAVDPRSGIVPPGASLDVAVTFDAVGLNGGDYEAQIVIANNDPLNPEVIVPVDLHVTGAPDIELSETLIDYGEVFIGAAIPHTLTVTNAGTDPLVVSNISSNHTDYTVDLTSVTLLPGESQAVVVTFAPTTVAPIAGTLTLVSNDPDEGTVTVTLEGEGLEPPVISVNPASLSDSLFTGETSTQTLTIANSGGNNLEFDIGTLTGEGVAVSWKATRSRVGAGPGPAWNASSDGERSPTPNAGAALSTDPHEHSPIDPVHDVGATVEPAILVIQDWDAWGVDMGEFIMSQFGVASTVINSSQIATTDFSDFHLIITTGDQSGEYYDRVSTNVMKFSAFVAGGGVVQYQLATQGDNVTIVDGVQVLFGNQENYNNNVMPSHPIMAGLPDVLEGNWANHCYLTNLPPTARVLTVTTSSGHPTTAEYDFGFGTVVATGMTWEFLYNRGYNAGPMLYNAVAYSMSLAGVKWLMVEPASGVVAPGESVDLVVTFQAEGLEGGDYEAQIVIANNDPLNPEVIVPAVLHVTGAPDIAVPDTLLDYGPVFITAVARDTLVVSNEGTDLLVVSGVSTSHGDYSVDPAAFTLGPGENQPVEVAFAPTTPGTIEGVLTIVSNDPDEGMVTVVLYGEGLEPPVIAVSPDSLADSLFTGDTSTHTLTVSNTGVHDLEFEIRVGEGFTAQSVGRQGAAGPPSTPWMGGPREGGALATGSQSVVPRVELGKGEEDTRSYPPMTRASGGPDPFGYSWRDSNDPGGPVFSWIDVSGGTPISLSDDDFSTQLPLGFTFKYYGQLFTTIGVGSNGWLSFVGYGYWYPADVPAVDDYAGAIAPFARDLNPPGANYIRYGTFGTAPNRKFVVEYNDIPNFAGGNYKTFEVIFYEGTDAIRFQYLTAPDDPVGFGIESPDQTMGMGNAGVGDLFLSPTLVQSAYAIEFTLRPPWLDVDPLAGTVPAGTSLDLVVTMNAAGLDGGDYNGSITIVSNDPVNSEVLVPVNLHVTATPDIAVSDTLLDFGPLFLGLSRSEEITVSNTGNDDLVVYDIASTSSDVSADPTTFTVSQGGTRAVTVTFTPTAAGIVSETLTITSNDPDEPEIIIAVMGQGLIPPEAVVTPDSLFEALAVGEASTRALTIANLGGSSLSYSISLAPWPPPSTDSSVVALAGGLQPPAERDGSLPGRVTEGSPVRPTRMGEDSHSTDPSPHLAPAPSGGREPGSHADSETETTVTWLSVSPTSGTVEPGNNAAVAVDFDATVLLGGFYQVVVVISTNVPLQPEIYVPVTLDVTGIPTIAVSDTLLEFGIVYLGYSKSISFTVENTGTDSLEVTDISADDPTFSATPTSFTIAPAHTAAVSVTHTPTELGPASAVLTIANNDPAHGVVEIDLTADVLAPPIVSVASDSIVRSLPPGEIRVDTLHVSNVGGSDLVWSVETSRPTVTMGTGPSTALESRKGSSGLPEPTSRDGEPVARGSLGTLDVLWHGDHGLGGIGFWSVIIADLTSRGATITQSSAPITGTLLAGVDIIWFGNRDVAFTTAEISALVEWVSDGGATLIEASSDQSRAVYNSLLESLSSGIVYQPMAGFAGTTLNIHPHETTVGVETINLLAPGNTLGAFLFAGPLVDDLLDHTVVAYDLIGDGRIVVMSDYIFHDFVINTADNRLFANQVFNWFGALSWLAVAPASGTIGAGETIGLEVTIDATVLLPGSYQRNIDIRSNDPATPVVTVPVCITVDSTVAVTAIDPDHLPTRYALHPNYPNPFNPTTTIAYDLRARTSVSLVIYDVAGREIRRMVSETQSPGRHVVLWDGRNASGEAVASGVYLYRLTAGKFVQTRKMLLLK